MKIFTVSGALIIVMESLVMVNLALYHLNSFKLVNVNWEPSSFPLFVELLLFLKLVLLELGLN